MSKVKTNDKITIVGTLCSFIFGAIIGGVVYLLIKIFDLKSFIWYIVFFFIPPVIGAIIYALSKTKMVKA